MLHYRRWLSALLALAVMLLSLCATAAAETIPEYDKNLPMNLSGAHLGAEAAALLDGVTGEVLFRKNSHQRMYPASTTKIMTLMLALESGIPMDMPIIIPQQAAQIPSDSTLVPVFPGDQMSFRDLLYGFMLSSGNDGANAVAVLVAGSLEAFVARMNSRAEELGCVSTHFANAHGYHAEDHYTTAEDLARITQEALKNETFRDIVARQSYTLTVVREGATIAVNVHNTNIMLRSDSRYYYPDCIGVKTGTHSRAGNCFVGAAERDGIQMIAVVLKSPQANSKWQDAIRLFDYGYTHYKAYTLDQMFTKARDIIATMKVSNAVKSDPDGGMLRLDIAQISDPEYIRMIQADNDEAMETAIADFVSRTMLTITHNMVAPVSEGEVMGHLRYVAQSGEVITALLVASRSIEAQPPRMSILDFFPFLSHLQDPLIRALILVIAGLIVLLIIAGIVRRASKQRRRSEIYEVRRREQRQEDREWEHRRLRRRMRNKASRRRTMESDYDDDPYDYDAYDDYDEYDEPDDDDFDAFDAFDEYDRRDYDEHGVRVIPKKKRRR